MLVEIGMALYRHCFTHCSFKISDATGSFPDYPDEEDGGSALIFEEKNPQQVEHTVYVLFQVYPNLLLELFSVECCPVCIYFFS